MKKILFLPLILFFALPAYAVDKDLDNLLARIERNERDLQTLQLQVFKGEAPVEARRGSPRRNDDMPSSSQQSTLNRLEDRLSTLESALRDLTGKVEELGFKNQQQRKDFDKLRGDWEIRFQQIETQLYAAKALTNPPPAAVTPVPAETLVPPVASAPPAPVNDGAQPSTDPAKNSTVKQLGVTKETKALPKVETPASADAKSDYDKAFTLLQQAEYDKAEEALKKFLNQHPNDALAANAQYWLGETYYVRGDYAQSSVEFLKAYQQYPKAPKAADGLLKLGLSLAQLKNKNDACITLKRLLREYPKAAGNLLKRAEDEAKRLQCTP
ncbi:MAG: tol-pal system protein YbgF [Dongiaceae bacterium]